MALHTIQELEACLTQKHECGALDEKTLDKRLVFTAHMVEELLKEFQLQEIPGDHSLDYIGNGCWKHENGGYISGVIDLPFNNPSPWQYQASLCVPELGIEGFAERVFDHFIDAHKWLGELWK